MNKQITQRLFLVLFIILLRYQYTFAEEKISCSLNPNFKIAIFKENYFPKSGVPEHLSPEWLYEELSNIYSVTYLDLTKLSDRKILNINNFDLLILPYGESFPYEAFSILKDFIFAGGGIFNLAGRPFWMPYENKNGEWEKVSVPDPYKEFLAPLGIKYYEFKDGFIGLSVTTSLALTPVNPTHGNVFPYRIPARDFFHFKDLVSSNPEEIIFVKSWRNVYTGSMDSYPQKWCFINSRGENHPLNPKQKIAKENLLKIINNLSCRIVLYDLSTNYCTYKPNEKIDIILKLLNNGRNNEKFKIFLKILDENQECVYSKNESLELKAGRKTLMHKLWSSKSLKGGFYKIEATLVYKDLVIDKIENGFVVKGRGITKGKSMGIQGKQFMLNGKPTYILGTNYYESKIGELMWYMPNINKIREDFKSMKALGLNYVRIRYHHPKWFRDYYSQIIKNKIDPYFNQVDTIALPSERSWRIMDAVIQLASEQDLIICFDIFTLVPNEMGNPIGWLRLKERITQRNKINFQKRFIKLLSQRYKDISGITWDLWNEPSLDNSDLVLLRKWAKEIIATFKDNGDNHLITIGDNLSLELLDTLDYASIHTYHPEEFIRIKNLIKPFIFQEVWNDTGRSLSEEIRQEQKLKTDFSNFLATEASGFIPWQWTNQARLWNNASPSEKWDDELGIFVHDDGTFKLAANAFSLLKNLAKEKILKRE